MLGFDGHLNTGLTLRTVRIANGVAEVRVGYRPVAPCTIPYTNCLLSRLSGRAPCRTRVRVGVLRLPLPSPPPSPPPSLAWQVRAGATLLFDSEPELEERETELKASAMRDAVLRSDVPMDGANGAAAAASATLATIPPTPRALAASRIVLVDHQDSFVHTLANYLRQTGALVTTLRSGFAPALLEKVRDPISPDPPPTCATRSPPDLHPLSLRISS